MRTNVYIFCTFFSLSLFFLAKNFCTSSSFFLFSPRGRRGRKMNCKSSAKKNRPIISAVNALVNVSQK